MSALLCSRGLVVRPDGDAFAFPVVGEGLTSADKLVQDMTDVLTSLCARLYGQRGAANRAKRALKAVAGKEL